MTNKGQKAVWGAVAVVLLAAAAGCGGTSAAQGAKHHPAKHHGSTKHTRQVALANSNKQRKHGLRHTLLHNYAVRISPVLSRSAAAFDTAVNAVAANHDTNSVGDDCNLQGSNITIMRSYFEGIPHPWRWYTHLGNVYGSAMGIYNYMLGALQACETASASGDSAGQATALSDMSSADSQMHSTAGYIRWAAHQR